MFGFGHHHKDQAPPASGPNQIFKIYCRASEDYCLAVRDGEVVLAPVNPKDETQHWLKDMRFSTTVKDEEGMPAFALVNKATGLAVKHSIGQLPFNPAYEDASVLWTESKDMGKGFRCIRMVNNTRLGFDALNGDKDHGGVHDGTTVVLWEWCKGDNQCWKIWPWAEAHAAVESGATMGNNAHAMGGGPPVHAVRVFCKAGEDYSLTARNGTVCLAPTNPRDDYQALDQGHEAQQQDQGRGRVPCVRTGEHGHRRMHQALHRPGPPREAGAVQPGVPGRVGAVDGEPRRGQGLPLRAHGEQHLPQLRRLPRRQGPRRRPRRHRDRALEVVRGRQPALEDPPLVDELPHCHRHIAMD
ncbi:unnamed protein product [Triticum turgidum subsp. durum]|uniref:Uncharacterized protein n=1 Tax=Triticum turgidum subsp. durum TaxID=4567 RepID=A0A9R1R2X2_TRITD|nr:unnamed protein product [Triticum turgidum subsp. durum]